MAVMKNGADAPPRSLRDVPVPRCPAPCLQPADIESKGSRPVSASSLSSTSLCSEVMPLSRSSSLS
jgi:hypothetical protein